MDERSTHQQPVGFRDGREIPLEAVRGIAAVVVVVYHGLMAFLPGQCGYFADLVEPGSLALSPWYGVLNGSAAVTVFFLLSAYVLTGPVFRSRDPATAFRAGIRRYPRLAAPVIVSVLLSWGLFAIGGYAFAQAAHLSGSRWLATFGEAEPWPFDTGLSHALAEGTWRTLVLGESDFNPALWTMRAELIGSLASLSAATAVVARGAGARMSAIALALAFAGCLELGPLVPFALGTALSHAMSGRRPALGTVTGLCAIAVALRLLAFNDAAGIPAAVLALLPFDAGMGKTSAHACAGVLLVVAATACAPVARTLSRRPLAVLGALSLPLYLVHVPILFSLGSVAFVALSGVVPRETAAAAAILLSLGASMAVAAPLAPLDRVWVDLLRRLARRVPADAESGPALRPRA